MLRRIEGTETFRGLESPRKKSEHCSSQSLFIEDSYSIKSLKGVPSICPSFMDISTLGLSLPVSNWETAFWLALSFSAKDFWLNPALILRSRIRAAWGDALGAAVRRTWAGLVLGLVAGLAFGFAAGLAFGLGPGLALIFGPGFALSGLAAGFVFGLGPGLALGFGPGLALVARAALGSGGVFDLSAFSGLSPAKSKTAVKASFTRGSCFRGTFKLRLSSTMREAVGFFERVCKVALLCSEYLQGRFDKFAESHITPLFPKSKEGQVYQCLINMAI